MPANPPSDYANEKEWMAYCVPHYVKKGDPQDQAVAVCMSLWGKKAAPQDSMNEQLEDVYSAFSRQFPSDMTEPVPATPVNMGYVDEVYPDYVIVEREDKKYKVAYSKNDQGEIVFVPFAEWVAVKEVTTYQPIDNTLKAIGETPDTLTVENHIILFGGRDATGVQHLMSGSDPIVNRDGSMGERFSPETDLTSDYTKAGFLHVDFEHGRDPDGIGNDVNAVLGYVDWKSARVDKVGVIVKRILNRRHRYMEFLEPLIKAGLVGTSSQVVEGQGAKAADGTIVRWPLKRDTLTFTPMEPRMLSANVLTACKAMTEAIPYYKSVIPLTDYPLDAVGNNSKSDKFNGVSKMTPEEETKAINDAVAAQIKAYQEAQEAKAAKDAAEKKALDDARAEGAKAALADAEKQGLLRRKHGYHTTERVNESDEGVGGFKAWMNTGEVNGDLISPSASFSQYADGKAAWNVTTGASGGYLVPDPLYAGVVAKRNLASFIRQAPVQVFETPADHLLVPVEDTSLTAFVKTAEGGAYDENEGTVAQKDLIQYKYTKLTKVNEEFMMYQGARWDAWFANALGRAEAKLENTIYTTGSGSSDVQGVRTGATSSGITLATVDTITPAEMTALIGTLPAGYNVQGEVGWLMANATKWYLRGLTGYNFQYSVTPSGGDPGFHGFPAYLSDDLAPYTTEADKPIIFGNWQFYGMIEKPGMIVQRNPYLYMATGQIGIFASIFRGGAVLQAEAFQYITSHA